MDRRAFLAGVGALLASPYAAAEAQPSGRVWRIGYLSVVAPDTDRSWVAAFRDGLREHGYREGENTVLELRHASQRLDALSALAAELVRLQVDVLVANGTPAVLAARNARRDLPIVMTVNGDPVGAGLVTSLARPGGTITGNSDGHADLGPKRLEILRAAVPSASRVAVVWNPATPQAVRQLENVRAAAPGLGVTLLPFEVAGPGELDRIFARIGKERAGALFIIPDQSWAQGQEKRIAALAIKIRLPSIGTVREQAAGGILMAYGANFHHLWRSAATYVDKILKGTKPADLPVAQPTKFDLVINLKTAKAIGLTIPRSLLLQADQVIE
jgi:putative ABC transport system substrate-binding protein